MMGHVIGALTSAGAGREGDALSGVEAGFIGVEDALGGGAALPPSGFATATSSLPQSSQGNLHIHPYIHTHTHTCCMDADASVRTRAFVKPYRDMPVCKRPHTHTRTHTRTQTRTHTHTCLNYYETCTWRRPIQRHGVLPVEGPLRRRQGLAAQQQDWRRDRTGHIPASLLVVQEHALVW